MEYTMIFDMLFEFSSVFEKIHKNTIIFFFIWNLFVIFAVQVNTPGQQLELF